VRHPPGDIPLLVEDWKGEAGGIPLITAGDRRQLSGSDEIVTDMGLASSPGSGICAARLILTESDQR
jgi:hypothetical protein